MSSLADVYGETSEGPDLRRLYLGIGLFLTGVLFALLAIIVASTQVLYGFGVDMWGARKIGGILAGVGVPAVLMGVFTVLPTSRRIKAAATIGASVCLLGVSMFWHAYPKYWVGSPYAKDLTLQVVGVYFLGLITAAWCLFTAVVNFKTRNDPGGTVTMEVKKEGEPRVIEVPKQENSDESYGGVGFLGERPEGEVETQTNRGSDAATPRTSTRDRSTGTPGMATTASSSTAGGIHPSPTSDGGASTDDISSPIDGADDGVVLEDGPDPNSADSYCGNCRHFEYVRTERGMQPYCGAHEETMSDMEACGEWAPNNAGVDQRR